jgi:recombination DNA repair RAD52 pathway protein
VTGQSRQDHPEIGNIGYKKYNTRQIQKIQYKTNTKNTIQDKYKKYNTRQIQKIQYKTNTKNTKNTTQHNTICVRDRRL